MLGVGIRPYRPRSVGVLDLALVTAIVATGPRTVDTARPDPAGVVPDTAAPTANSSRPSSIGARPARMSTWRSHAVSSAASRPPRRRASSAARTPSTSASIVDRCGRSAVADRLRDQSGG